MPELACSSHREDGLTVFAVSGEAGVAASQELEIAVARLLSTQPERLVIDLNQLAFVSSLGIGQLMMLAQHVTKSGGAAAVVVPENDLRVALKRCRLHQIAPFATNRADAIAALRAP